MLPQMVLSTVNYLIYVSYQQVPSRLFSSDEFFIYLQ